MLSAMASSRSRLVIQLATIPRPCVERVKRLDRDHRPALDARELLQLRQVNLGGLGVAMEADEQPFRAAVFVTDSGRGRRSRESGRSFSALTGQDVDETVAAHCTGRWTLCVECAPCHRTCHRTPPHPGRPLLTTKSCGCPSTSSAVSDGGVRARDPLRQRRQHGRDAAGAGSRFAARIRAVSRS